MLSILIIHMQIKNNNNDNVKESGRKLLEAIDMFME